MKKIVPGALVVLFALGAAARAQEASQASPAAAEVSVHFAAVDKQNNPVESLGPEDIKVTQGGRTQAVSAVRRLSGLPLSLVVAVDTSASQERVIGGTKRAADSFVSGVMRAGVDEFGVVTFTGAPTLEQRPTGDAAKVREAIARVKAVLPAGYVGSGVIVGQPPRTGPPLIGSTAIWDAVSFVSRDVLASSPAAARRALILITDGVDTSSRLKLADAVRDALSAETVVYAIGIGDEQSFDGVDKGGLRKLTERTGGRAFFPKEVGDLVGIFKQIQAELLSPYVATFAAPDAKRDGSPRKLKLEVANPELRRRGVRLLHPESYIAK